MDFITEPNPRLSSSWQHHVFRSQFRYFPPRGHRNASLLASDSSFKVPRSPTPPSRTGPKTFSPALQGCLCPRFLVDPQCIPSHTRAPPPPSADLPPCDLLLRVVEPADDKLAFHRLSFQEWSVSQQQGQIIKVKGGKGRQTNLAEGLRNRFELVGDEVQARRHLY